jgi:hypothetical protein
LKITEGKLKASVISGGEVVRLVLICQRIVIDVSGAFEKTDDLVLESADLHSLEQNLLTILLELAGELSDTGFIPF